MNEKKEEIPSSNSPEKNQDSTENNEQSEDLKKMLQEFADLDTLSEEDLKDMQDAIQDNIKNTEIPSELDSQVKQPSLSQSLLDTNELNQDIISSQSVPVEPQNILENGTLVEPPKPEFKPEIDAELEKKIQEEIERKRAEIGVKTITREEFINYLKDRRNKIVYHALWFLVFNIDSHKCTKVILYEALKDVTSKNAVESIEQHKFYFGLGFILRLRLFDQSVVVFEKDSLKINVNVENLQIILKEIGEPISERPIMAESEKKDMFSSFLHDDFIDLLGPRARNPPKEGAKSKKSKTPEQQELKNKESNDISTNINPPEKIKKKQKLQKEK